jgi:hypothetical protein
LSAALLLILWVSGICSAIIDNIPFTTMMIPVITGLGKNPDVQVTISGTEISSLKRFRTHCYPGGRCYDHNFLRFSPIFGEKMAFFLNTNVMINVFQNLALF